MDMFTKQPAERYAIEADFSEDIQGSEEIDAVLSEVSAVDCDGEDASSEVLDSASMIVSSHIIQIDVLSGETGGSPYTITFSATTDRGRTYVIQRAMYVVEGGQDSEV